MEVLSECPQHQLTCRRVKDSLAKLYNTIQSWSSLSSSSFDTLSRLLNILTEEQHLHEGGGATVGEIGGKEARIRLEGKLIDRREKLYSELRQSLDAMVSACVCVYSLDVENDNNDNSNNYGF